MYTLRILCKKKVEGKFLFKGVENHCLGNSYIVKRRDLSYDFPIDMIGVDTVVEAEKGATYPIEESNQDTVYSYFIMTESGQTFERL